LAFGINLLSRKDITLIDAFNTAIYGMKSKGSKKKVAHESELQSILFSKTIEAYELGKHALNKINVEPYSNVIASKCYKG
jgi:thiamine biosynthesis lipoprotein ApbE